MQLPTSSPAPGSGFCEQKLQSAPGPSPQPLAKTSRLQPDRVSWPGPAKEAGGLQALGISINTEENTKKSKLKRNRRKESRNKDKDISLMLMGNSANSLVQKMESLEYVLCVEKPSVMFLQETKLWRPGRIKTPNSLSTHGMSYTE